jgi:hypothetical protein
MDVMYLCHDLSDEESGRDAAAILDFPCVMNRVVPGIQCSVARLGDDLVKRVLEVVKGEEDFHGIAAEISFLLEPQGIGPIPALVVCCRDDSTLAKKAKAKSPHALWGCACGGLVAIYRHDPYLIWHEMFHLFGADDCYEVGPKGEIEDHTCGNIQCIMQYAPSEETVGLPLTLCDKNVRKIRERNII